MKGRLIEDKKLVGEEKYQGVILKCLKVDKKTSVLF